MKLIMEPVNVKDLINEAAEVVSPLLNQKRELSFSKTVHLNTPEVFTADKTKAKQILVNLLSNAVKFTSSGRIRLSVRLDTDQNISESAGRKLSFTKTWTRECKSFIKFSVKDTGIGVDGSDFERIFSAFEQVLR